MKVGIIGYGFVGKAVESVMCDPVAIVDPLVKNGLSLSSLLDSEIIFICVPTPTVDGKCDYSLVLDYVKQLSDYAGLVIVKSTVPPAAVERIFELRSGTVIWPEFLREKHAMYDIKYPRLLVIGAHSNEGMQVISFIKYRTNIVIERGKTVIKHVTPIQASVFKYLENSFLATKVVFMHQAYLWLKSRGEEDSWPFIADLIASEGRLGASHLEVPGEHGFGFSGTCFPKDTEALKEQAEEDGLKLGLLSAVIEENKKLQKLN